MNDPVAPKKKKKKLVTIKKDPENNKFMCEICEVTFSRKKDLKDHKISVHDEKNPFGCNLCDYSCRQRGNLNRHMITAHTGKSFSESLILASTNPQYDKRLFIDLPVQYMKTTSSDHGDNMLCVKIVLNVKTKNNFCAEHVLPMF